MNKFHFSLATAGQINTAADFSEKGSLIAGQTRSLRNGMGMRVTCNSGFIWVTQEGDPQDHVLGASESIVLSGKGRACLSSLSSLGAASYRLA